MQRLFGTFVVACLVAVAMAPSAFADFGVRSFDGEFSANASGAPATQAGSHPDHVGATLYFNLEPHIAEREGKQFEEPIPAGQAKEIDVELPAGLIGDPSAAPKCPAALIAALQACPQDTQIGLGGISVADERMETFPLYNVVAPPEVPGLLGFTVLDEAPVSVTASVRPAAPASQEGYGLDLHIHDIPQAITLEGASLTFDGLTAPEGPQTPTAAREPFVTMPTSCSGEPLTLRAHVTSWEGATSNATFVAHDKLGNPLHTEGCGRLPFAPRFATALDTGATDSPTGLSVEVQTPQNRNPEGLASAHLKSTTVSLPAGLSIDPSAANGLSGCSVAQFDQFGEAPSTCPDSSKVGTVEIDTPLIPDPISGGIYLAKQGENPFGSLVALYLIGEGDGIKVKLPGKVVPDPSTGQLTATFEETPQLPFEVLKLHFFDGPGAALATPVVCGTASVSASLTPWSGNPPVARESSIEVDSGTGGSACPAGRGARPFGLGFEAGTVSPAAASHSPLDLNVTRPDGAQELGRIDATLPKGLLATLKGVPECSGADAAAGTCGAASQVGSLAVGAGAGPNPFYLRSGRAYLTGPYGGAPLGLDFVVPVVAGPLDLGAVNVRAALSVDPETTQVTVRSDQLPTILQGIPLRLRSVSIGIDRPGFIVNPTSCDPTTLASQVTSTEGAVANLSDRFQAAGCRGLAFKPKLTSKLLGGRKALKRRAHPRLRVTVKEPEGQANLAGVRLTMPKSILLDQDHIKTVCTRVEFAAGKCPRASIYGFAKVTTPLLGEPLEGPVYLRSSSHTLPDLVIDLKGQIDVVLSGRIDSHKGGLRVTLDSIPDAAVGNFVLTMKGGARGLLQNSVNLCKAKARVDVAIRGQNGALRTTRPALASSCGRAKKARPSS